MTPVSPKGPERGARPEEASLQERVAEQFRVRWGYAETNELVKRYARDAIDVLRPELEQITFERDAAQQAADVLCDQLKDLRDDVLGDESLLVPEIVSAAGRTVERLTAEVERLRELTLDKDEARAGWFAVAGKERDGKIAALAEVSRLREQLATAVVLPQDADEQIHTALEVNTGVHTGGQLADQTDAVLALIRSWGVSSSEAEAPRPQEMTQHRVNIDRARWDDRVSFAACRDCPEKCCGDPSDVEFWRDRHQADTLRPTLTNESFISSQDEGRPSVSKAATPRPMDELLARLRGLVFDLQDEGAPSRYEYDNAYRDGQVQAGNDLEALLDEFAPIAAQAARSEATPEDENDAIEFTRYLGGAQS